jgi:hypothetical protein
MATSRFVIDLLRPDDLLALEVELRNLKRDTTDPKNPKLVIDNTSHPAYMIVGFPPQSVAEKAYFEVAKQVTDNPPFNQNPPPPPLPAGSDSLDPAGAVPARMAGRSRLVFRVPATVKVIPYSIAGLLDWSPLDLMLSPAAVAVPKPPPLVSPSSLQTALELPYRLILSPGSGVGWAHSKIPQTHAGRTELWHTRLGKVHIIRSKSGSQKKIDEASEQNTISLRAIWSPDFEDHAVLPDPADEGPFLSTMSPRDRAEIVILTSGVKGYYVEDSLGGTSVWVPKPIHASRLFLSALGGWLTSRGSWPIRPSFTPSQGPTQSLELSDWRHVATQGRDHYVRIVYEGYLYPFGHRASLVKVTERKVLPTDGAAVTQPTAYLIQHMYVVVREPEKSYGSESYVYGHREMPFWQSVRIRTPVTPDIDKPSYLPDGTSTPSSFWINVNNAGFLFHLSAQDLAGTTVDFTAQLIFMSDAEPNPTAIQSLYSGSGDRRLCPVKAQNVAYADPAAGDTTLKTTGLYFDTELVETGPPYPVAPFLPFLSEAAVMVPALEQLLGTSTPVSIELYDGYLKGGLDPHAGVFAELSSAPPNIAFSADKSGGFATPNLSLRALSARKGLVAGEPSDAAAGLIDPADFFADISAQLFGTIPIKDLIPIDKFGKADAGRNAPEIRTHTLPNAKHPQTLETAIKWSPQLKDFSLPPVEIQFNHDGTSALALSALIQRNLKGGPPSSRIHGQLTNFRINLLGVVALKISSIKFSSENGQKTNVEVKLPSQSAITFIGPLSFVQTLADILPPGIFGGAGPSIQLQPTQLRVTYTLGLPPIGIGVFSLENISLLTGLDLPYLDGKPGFEFAFATRSSPFLLTVECLGGGGFVHVVLNADGVQMVEGALEFGAECSLDLGVASGGVHIMAGIYFQLKGTSSDLTGFVDVGGEVSVLGIISISLDLNLSLSYIVSGGKKLIQGRATLTVSVHVLFFSASVAITMEKSFASTAGDPRIEQLITAEDWAAYAAAFA